MAIPLLGRNEALLQRYSEKSGAFKLLLWIIVIKPLFNTLVALDILGISVSILQVLGFVIILTLVWGLLTNESRPHKSSISVAYTLFFIVYAFNLILVVVFNPELDTIKDFLKVLTTPLIFYFYSRSINDDLDLELVLHAFLISIIPLSLVFIYDSLIIGSYQETRGLERIDTSFGDITTFGFQVNIICIITLFGLLKVDKVSKSTFIKAILISFFSLYVLISIAHGASFGVFAVIMTIFAVFYFRKNLILLILVFTVLIIPSYLLFADWFNVFFDNFYGNELEALDSGQSLNEGRFFHGRMSRWQRLFELFLDQNFFDQFIGGVAISYPYMIGHGPHNDFLRVILSSGYLGFFFYLAFLITLFFKSLPIGSKGIRFLGFATLANLLIYSITTTPSTYIDYNLFVMSVLVYIAKYNPSKSAYA